MRCNALSGKRAYTNRPEQHKSTRSPVASHRVTRRLSAGSDCEAPDIVYGQSAVLDVVAGMELQNSLALVWRGTTPTQQDTGHGSCFCTLETYVLANQHHGRTRLAHSKAA